MSSEMEEGADELTIDRQNSFVSMLQFYPVLLSKSQVPSVKTSKKKALEQLIEDIRNQQGLLMSAEKIMKKIGNMKTIVKKKTDLNATGNKKIVLLEWETAFLTLLRPTTNPTLARVPGTSETFHKF